MSQAVGAKPIDRAHVVEGRKAPATVGQDPGEGLDIVFAHRPPFDGMAGVQGDDGVATDDGQHRPVFPLTVDVRRGLLDGMAKIGEQRAGAGAL